MKKLFNKTVLFEKLQMKGYYGSSCHARIRTCTCAQHARRVLGCSKGIIHNVMTGLNVEYTKLAEARPESDESE